MYKKKVTWAIKYNYTIKKFIAMVYIMLCQSLESVG